MQGRAPVIVSHIDICPFFEEEANGKVWFIVPDCIV
jgi:hypothetical protein